MRFADDPTVWALHERDSNECRGIYTSESELKDGVKYWILQRPNENLYYAEWTINYAPEPNSWEWAYIVEGSNPHDLASGGGSVPERHFWGKNLVGVLWTAIPEWKEAY